MGAGIFGDKVRGRHQKQSGRDRQRDHRGLRTHLEGAFADASAVRNMQCNRGSIGREEGIIPSPLTRLIFRWFSFRMRS